MKALLTLPLLALAALAARADDDRPFFGVSLREMTGQEKEDTGLASGVAIDRILPAGEAGKAGLEKGDIVVTLDGNEIKDVSDFSNTARELTIGEAVEIVFFRDGKEMTLQVAPGSFLKWNSMEGEAAPKIEFQAWCGDEIKWDDLKGKIVVLSFFEIISEACETVRPGVETLAEDLGARGVRVIGVHTAFEEFDQQTPEKVKAFVKEKEFGYPVGLAKGGAEALPAVLSDYRLDAVPCLVVIDRRGKVRFKQTGPFEPEAVKSLIEGLLKDEEGKK